MPGLESRPSKPPFGLAVSPDTSMYHHDVVYKILAHFKEQIRLEHGEYPNGMPLYLVGAADNVVLINWINGDNYQTAMSEISLVGQAFKVNPDATGANCKQLRLILPFADFRQHDRGRKYSSDLSLRGIVQGQGVTDEVMVKTFKHIAGIDDVITVDIHNPYRSERHFEAAGLKHLNLTANRVFCRYLLDEQIISPDDEIVIASTDAGSLDYALDLSKKMGKKLGKHEPIPLALNVKVRNGDEVDQTLVCGNVDGQVVITGDDMISGGSTTKETIDKLRRAGAKRIVYLATHPVFVQEYYNNLCAILEDPNVTIAVTNSIPFLRKGINIPIPYVNLGERINRVHVIDIAEFLIEITDKALHIEDYEALKTSLREDTVLPTDPYQLLSAIAGRDVHAPLDNAIYDKGTFYSLPG